MSRRTRLRRNARRNSGHPRTWRQRALAFVPFRSWKLQLGGAVVGIAAAILSAQSFASAREAVNSYLIQPGDTLLAIATTTGVALDKLVALNGIKNPDLIIAGQALSLDGSVAVTSGATSPGYTVKAGDTLWGISIATGAPLDALINLNNLSNADTLSVGQVLALSAPTAQRTMASKPSAAAAQTAAAQTSAAAQASAAPEPAAASQSPAAAAKPKPAAAGQNQTAQKPPKANPLQQKIAAEALRVGGPNVHVGAAATNLVTGEKVSLHGEDLFPSASVMKLPILVELERQIANGTLAWNESLRAEAGAMIAVSDNTAANQIADVIHTQSVNDTMARLGLGSTRFLNPFADTRSSSNPGQNQTTPANMGHLLELIATDQVISSQASADIRALLARNVDRSKLVRLLPSDARVAHKSGWYEGVANDVGIVTVDRVPTRWVIAVLTDNLPDGETGNQVVAAISKAVYDAWAP